MRKKMALLLVLSLLMSLIPAQIVRAQELPEGEDLSGVTAPRHLMAARGTEAPQLARFASFSEPIATSPVSLTVQSPPTEARWARNNAPTLFADGVIGDYFTHGHVIFPVSSSIATPAALGLNLNPDRLDLWGLCEILDATLEFTIGQSQGTVPSGNWGGVLTVDANGNGNLWLEFFQLPVGNMNFTLSFYINVQGYGLRLVRASFSLNRPAAIPEFTIGAQRGTLTAGQGGTAEFTISTSNIPAGTHPIGMVFRVPAPGISWPEYIVIDANGNGTLVVTGDASMVQNEMFFWLDIFYPSSCICVLNCQDVCRNWAVYARGRLSIGAGDIYIPDPPSTPPPTEEPAPQPPRGDTVKVFVRKEVTTTIIVNVINQAREKGERPVVEIELEDDEDGVIICGNDVKDLIENDGILIIISSKFKIQFTATQMANWNLTVESEVTISLRPVEDSEEVDEILRDKDKKPGGATNKQELLDLLLTVLVEVTIEIDGTVVAGGQPYITVDISEMNLTARQKAGLTAVFFFLADPDDPTSLTYILIEGVLDGNLFTVPVSQSGWFSLMSLEVSITTTVRLQVGSTLVTQNGEPRAGLDVAPFLVNPGDPDSLMLPLRALAEALGATVQWNAQLRVVMVVHVNFSFSFSVDEPLPDDMGDVEIVEDRTFVPRRFLAERMGVSVDYDQNTGAIYVTYDEYNNG
jgi:hypothetical protein